MENIIRKYLKFIAFVNLILFINCAPSNAENIDFPQHIVNVWWFCDVKNSQIDNITIDFSINGSENASYIYIAPLGKITLAGIDMYGGIQSNLNGWISPENRKIRAYGSGGIFSRWRSKSDSTLTTADMIIFSDTIVELGTYEGEFASVRKEFRLENGNYRYILEFEKTHSRNVIAYVLTPKGKLHKLGGFKLGFQELKIENFIASFFEIYSNAYYVPDGFDIIFRPPVVNGLSCIKSDRPIIIPKYKGKQLSERFKINSNSNTVKITCCNQ